MKHHIEMYWLLTKLATRGVRPVWGHLLRGTGSLCVPKGPDAGTYPGTAWRRAASDAQREAQLRTASTREKLIKEAKLLQARLNAYEDRTGARLPVYVRVIR